MIWILANVGKILSLNLEGTRIQIDVQVNILIEIRTWKMIFKYSQYSLEVCKTFIYRVQGTDHPYKRKICKDNYIYPPVN